jgi:hypothetical protein
MRGFIASSIFATAACCLTASAASAYRPKETVAVFGYVCDTKEQAESLPKAHKQAGYQAAITQYAKLRATLNSHGEPVCAFSNRQFSAELIREVASYPDIEIAGENGEMTTKTFYVIEGRSATGIIVYIVIEDTISLGL